MLIRGIYVLMFFSFTDWKFSPKNINCDFMIIDIFTLLFSVTLLQYYLLIWRKLGQWCSVNYRGQSVTQHTMYLNSSKWHILLKIDQLSMI